MQVPTEPSWGEDGAFAWSFPLFQPQDVSLSVCRQEDGGFGWSFPLFQPQDGRWQEVLEQVQLHSGGRMLSAPLSWNSWAECCLSITEGRKIMSHYEWVLAHGQSSEDLGRAQWHPWHQDTDTFQTKGLPQPWERGDANPGMETKLPVCNRADTAECFPESHPAKALI